MTEDAVQKIKSSISLSEVVGRYARLEKKGSRYMACCPFHGEKTPSFSVDNQRGVFYCFGCKKGGDLISFVQAIENLTFIETLEFLADLAGIELPKRGRMGPDRKTVDLYREINERACQFFEKNLDRDKEVQAYLKERGLNAETVKLFRIGVAPASWDGLYRHLEDQFPREILAKCGLFKPGKKGGFYDLFRDRRVIFPIFDVHGNTIAFGGRRWKTEGPKYINSPESPIYVKGKHVYNLNFAKPYLKKKPELIVVEGYMDVIQVYQAGFGAVVAPLGTAFTDDQARLIKRYSSKVYLNFDGDQAGFQAARKSIDVLLGRDLDPWVVSLPEGRDPDDFILKEGRESYEELMAQSRDFFSFLFNAFKGEDEDISPRKASAVIQELLPTLQRIKDPIILDGYLKDLAGLTGVSLNAIYHLKDQKTKSQPTAEPPRMQVKPASDLDLKPVEEQVLRILLKVPEARNCLNSEDSELFDTVLTHLFVDRPWIVAFLHETDVERFQTLGDMPDAIAMKLKRILMDDDLDPMSQEEAESQFYADFQVLTIMYLEQMSERLSSMRKQMEGEDSQRTESLLRRKSEIERKIRQLRNKVNSDKGRKS